MEKHFPVPKEVINAYKSALQTKTEHKINGQSYIAKPIEKDQFYNLIYKELGGNEKDDPLFNSSEFKTSIKKALQFTINNSESFCGIAAPEYYKNNDENYEEITGNSIIELTDITNILINNNAQGIEIPSQMKDLFSNIKPSITFGDIAKGTRRGFKTAENCHVCEQADPVIGGAVHATAGILNKIIESSGDFSSFWKENYSETIHELSSPKTTGLVYVLIKITELNQIRYPYLTKFFGSEVDLPESNFKGTYFDMVNVDEYIDSK